MSFKLLLCSSTLFAVSQAAQESAGFDGEEELLAVEYPVHAHPGYIRFMQRDQVLAEQQKEEFFEKKYEQMSAVLELELKQREEQMLKEREVLLKD